MANTAPGCWGPMITPHIKGGHEVTLPTAVSGAEVGDAVAIRIKSITITRQCVGVLPCIPAAGARAACVCVCACACAVSRQDDRGISRRGSIATASGNDYMVDGKYKGDPYCGMQPTLWL